MGKTKDIIYVSEGSCVFKFKDDVTSENGVFNPGANTTGELKINGMGRASLLLSHYFFPIIRSAGIPTHDIKFDTEDGTMLVHKLDMLPIEFIWRNKSWGSFCKMYGVEKGILLNGLIEATLKDDSLGDPRINCEAAVKLGFISEEQYNTCDAYTRKIGDILFAELSVFDYELIDFKVEFGINSNGVIVLGDEISGGIWRLLKDGQPVDPIDCAKTICPAYYPLY